MSNMIKIGKEANIDLNKLIDSRLLVQANSGGGKSWLLRKLLEESHGKVQHIILDLEGEFSTLREKHDYLLVGKEGDIPADIKSAGLLAKKVLELNVSVIIDLYELKHHERILYVKKFLDAMINAPKSLWHPCIVVVDEVHVFAPEKGKAESLSSVIELCTRGRKRGYCAVLATQRLSKLHKDAAAECNNKLIGRTGLDIDMKRASDELGFNNKEQLLSLRNLAAGEFYSFGPAISHEVKKIKIGDVKTTHPQSGGRQVIITPPATDKIKETLSKLLEIPKEAENELIDLQDYKKEITKLRTDNTRLRNTDFEKEKLRIKEKSFKEGFIKGKSESKIETVKTDADKILLQISNIVSKYKFNHAATNNQINNTIKVKAQSGMVRENNVDANINSELGICAKKIYSFLYSNPSKGFSKVQIALVTGYSMKSSGFKASISALNVQNLIRKEENLIYLGDDNPDIVISGEQKLSVDFWFSKLGKCPAEIFKVLLDNPDMSYSKEDLANNTETQYSINSSGFKASISKLNVLEIIKKSNGLIKLNPEINEL